MWKTVRMSQDGACPGDFMLQNVNCPRVKLGQEFPGVAFWGHLRSFPKLMEITSSSHASKSFWSCWYCSLAEYTRPLFFIAIRIVYCAAVHSVLFCQSTYVILVKEIVICRRFYSLNWKQCGKRENEMNSLLWFRMCLKSRDCTEHAAVVKVILAII